MEPLKEDIIFNKTRKTRNPMRDYRTYVNDEQGLPVKLHQRLFTHCAMIAVFNLIFHANGFVLVGA